MEWETSRMAEDGEVEARQASFQPSSFGQKSFGREEKNVLDFKAALAVDQTWM